MTSELIVSEGQSLADVAVQVYGELAAVFGLADDNGLLITDRLAAGQVLIIDPARVQNAQVTAYLSARAVVVNNGALSIEQAPDPEPTTPDFHRPDFDSSDFN